MFRSMITLLLLYLIYAIHPNIVDSYFYILSCEFDEYLNELQWMHLLLTPLVYNTMMLQYILEICIWLVQVTLYSSPDKLTIQLI